MVNDGALDLVPCRLCVTISQVALAICLRGECIIAQGTLVRSVAVVCSEGGTRNYATIKIMGHHNNWEFTVESLTEFVLWGFAMPQ